MLTLLMLTLTTTVSQVELPFRAGLPQAAAQAPIAPGSAMLDPSRIAPRTDAFDLVTWRDGAEVGRMRLTRTIARGQPAAAGATITFTQRYETPAGITTDTTVLDAASLAPLRYTAELGGETHRLAFTGDRVTGIVEKAEGTTTVDERLATPSHCAVSLELLYEAIALRAGFEARIPAFNPPGTAMTIRIAVSGEDSVSLVGGARARAWKLTFDSGRGAPSDVWVERDSGRLLVILIGNGRDGFIKARTDVNVSALLTRKSR